MKIKISVSVLVCIALLGALPGSVVPVAAKAKAAPMVVGTDPADDWGANASAPSNAPGDFLGQELTEASLHSDGKNIHFIIGLNSLPPWGGIPEVTRYNWDFMVNGNAYQLTGGWTEFARGVCNPLHTGACPPPANPGLQPFFLRQGPCTVGADCTLLATYQATFDPAEATITIPVPYKDVKAKKGSKVTPGASLFGGTIYAAPAAFVSNASLPADTMVLTKSYKIP